MRFSLVTKRRHISYASKTLSKHVTFISCGSHELMVGTALKNALKIHTLCNDKEIKDCGAKMNATTYSYNTTPPVARRVLNFQTSTGRRSLANNGLVLQHKYIGIATQIHSWFRTAHMSVPLPNLNIATYMTDLYVQYDGEVPYQSVVWIIENITCNTSSHYRLKTGRASVVAVGGILGWGGGHTFGDTSQKLE